MQHPATAREEATQRLSADLARCLRADPIVRLAWLFGSRARGTERRDSDVDVAVLVDDACVAGAAATKDTLFRVIGAAAGAVRSDLIDLVLLNHAPVLLRHRVLRDGVLLFARSDAERVRFVHGTLTEYLDMEPRLRMFTRARVRRLRQAWNDDGGYGDPLAAT